MTVTTAQIPASAAQLGLIRRLRQERGAGVLTPDDEAILTGGRQGTASAMISALLATSARPSQPSAEMPRGPSAYGDEQLPTPVTASRTGRMMLAGQVTATVTLPGGQHVTVHVRSYKRNPGTGRRWIAASPLDPEARTVVEAGRRGRRIGRVREGRMTWNPGITSGAKAAVRVLFAEAASALHSEGDGYRIQVEDACGRCGRALTDPESIDRGIGPECFGRITASQHAQVSTDRTPRTDLTRAERGRLEHLVQIANRNGTPQTTTEYEDEADEQVWTEPDSRDNDRMINSLGQFTDSYVAPRQRSTFEDEADEQAALEAQAATPDEEVPGADAFATAAMESAEANRREAASDTAFAERERAQENRAYETEMEQDRARWDRAIEARLSDNLILSLRFNELRQAATTR